MWATIIMAILSFILTKKKTGSTSTALAAAALAGAGTYYATTRTDWFDGDNPLTSWPGADKATSGGQTVTDANGKTVYVPGTSLATGGPTGAGLVGQTIDTTGKVLTSWGGTGTATVIGASNLTSGRSGLPDWAKVAGIFGIGFLLLK